MAPFDRSHTSSYSSSIVTMTVHSSHHAQISQENTDKMRDTNAPITWTSPGVRMRSGTRQSKIASLCHPTCRL